MKKIIFGTILFLTGCSDMMVHNVPSENQISSVSDKHSYYQEMQYQKYCHKGKLYFTKFDPDDEICYTLIPDLDDEFKQKTCN